MPIALTTQALRPAARTTRAVLSGLDQSTPPPTPGWAKPQLAVDVLIGSGLKLPCLLDALGACHPDIEDDRASAVDWVAGDDFVVAVDLTLPLLVLARDIKQLGEGETCAELVLEGA